MRAERANTVVLLRRLPEEAWAKEGRHTASGRYTALDWLKRVDLGIRPQALRLVPPAPGRIIGHVFLREPLGLEDEVLVETAGGARVNAVTASGEEFPEGAAVALDFAPRDLYIFHPESGLTLCHGTD